MDDLLLLSGNDIPFLEAQLTIHQPTIKEIAYVGEEHFFTGCELMNFSKDNLSDEDRINLEHFSNFEILMSMIKEKNPTMQEYRLCLFMVLALIFPEYSFSIETNENIALILSKENEENKIINKDNFEQLKKIINKMFINKQSQNDYNPQGELAKKIANKLKNRKQAQQGESNKKISVFSRYISILAVGEHKDMNSLLNYTVYQLLDEFERFNLKVSNDIYLQAKMAGATGLKEVDDWMKDIHS